jgi:hypothetical protein
MRGTLGAMRKYVILVVLFSGCMSDESLPGAPPLQGKRIDLSPPTVPEAISPPYEFTEGGPVTPPVVIERFEPNWDRRAATTVVLKALIDQRGDVRHVSVTSGADTRVRRAATALYRWKFRPATFRGEPVAVVFRVKVEASRSGGT